MGMGMAIFRYGAASAVLGVMLSLGSALPAVAQSFDENVKTISKELGAQMKERNAEKVAVVGFSDLNGFQSAFGDFLSEELVSALFGAGDFDVVERREINRVLTEQSGYDPDLFDSENLAAIGKLLGVEVIISGTITDLGSSVRLNSRAISVETGRIIGASSATFAKDEAMTNLLLRPAAQLSPARELAPGFIQQPGSLGVRNKWVSIEPTSVFVGSDRKQIKVTAEIRNISGTDICLSADSAARNTKFTTDLGDFIAGRTNGWNAVIHNVTGLSQSYEKEEAGANCTPLNAGDSLFGTWDPVSNTAIEGRQLNISTQFFVVHPGGITATPVRLQNIQLN